MLANPISFAAQCTTQIIQGATHGLAERPALANGNLVTLLDTESGRDVGGEVLVALLVTGVLGDEVEILPADDEGAVHLGGDDSAGQDTATDGDEAGEGALLVCIVAFRSANASFLLIVCISPSKLAFVYRCVSFLGCFDRDAILPCDGPTYRCSCPQWRQWES